MGNTTSSRLWPFRRTRLLTISAVVGAIAVLVFVGTLTLTGLNLRHVHASGTGYMCTSTTGPVCNFSGHSAWAQFESNSDCMTTDAFVWASENFTRAGATTTPSSYIYVNTYSYNTCTGDYSYGWGDNTGSVQFSQPTNTLTAQGNIDVYTYHGDGTTSTVTYALNGTWKGIGKLTREVDSFHFQSLGVITHGHYSGTSQNSIVSGTFSDGTTNLAATPAYGEWIDADSGTFITIQK